MKHHAVEVPPYIEKYMVLDKSYNNICVYKADSLYEAICYVYANTADYPYNRNKISYKLYRESATVVYNYSRKDYTKIPPARYVIVNEAYVSVTIEDVFAANQANSKPYRYRFRGPDFGKNLVKVKNDFKKIKNSYRTYARTWRSWHYTPDSEFYYSNAETRYYRHPQTQREARIACGHADEYGLRAVRPKRNHTNLPDTYDDLQSCVYNTRKSWKHNSKRRKQWIPK